MVDVDNVGYGTVGSDPYIAQMVIDDVVDETV